MKMNDKDIKVLIEHFNAIPYSAVLLVWDRLEKYKRVNRRMSKHTLFCWWLYYWEGSDPYKKFTEQYRDVQIQAGLLHCYPLSKIKKLVDEKRGGFSKD